MKKIAFLIFTILLVNTAFSQKADITTAILAIQKNDIIEAKRFIDKASLSVEEKTRNGVGIDAKTHSKFWFYKGEIYFKILTSKNSEISSLEDNSLDIAAEAYKKYLTIDINKRPYLNPDEAKARINFCAAHYNNRAVDSYQSKDYVDALHNFEKRLTLLEGLQINVVDTITIESAMLSARYAKKYEQASYYCNKLIELDYNAPYNYLFLSEMLKEQGDTIESVNVVKKGRGLFPTNYELLIAEYNYLLVEGKEKEAMDILELAIKENPNNTKLYGAIGSLLLNQKSHDQAIEYFKQAIDIDPNYAEGQYQLGVVYVEKANDLSLKANDLPISAKKEYNKIKIQITEMFKKALPYFENAYKLNLEDTHTLNALREVYYKLEMYEESKQAKEGVIKHLVTE